MAGNLDSYRWEYSPPARWGDFIWARLIDPALRVFGDDELTALRRLRGVMQIVLLLAILPVPASFFWKPSHLLAASGLLFDIAGVLRLFLLEEIEDALAGFTPNKYGNFPSVATRELIMPEDGPYDADSLPISLFYYRKRGILFLFIGFALQFIATIVG